MIINFHHIQPTDSFNQQLTFLMVKQEEIKNKTKSELISN